jgi:hypothetical protein
MKPEGESIENLMVDLDHYTTVIHSLCVKLSNKETLSDDDYVELANARSVLCNTMALISSKFLNDFCRNSCGAEHRDKCIGYYGKDAPKCEFYQEEKSVLAENK